MSRTIRVWLLLAAVALTGGGCGQATQRAAAPPAVPAFASISLASGGGALTIPPSYFGVSTEYWGLQLDGRHLAAFEQVLARVHVRGGGPVVLRVGGDSADFTYWPRARETLAPGTFRLTRAWFARTATLVRQMNLRVIIDLNVIARSPAMAGRVARAALAYLPKGSVIGFEIGNEPDDYTQHLFRLVALSPPRLAAIAGLKRYTPADYVQTFRSYAKVLRRVAPHVPLLGPALASPARNIAWLEALVAAKPPGLAALTVHRYPLSACLKAPDRCSVPGFCFPTVQRLLSEASSAGLAQGLAPAARIARTAGLPLRVDEANSVTCGGLRGVSNTFATALWLPDALLEMRRLGAASVNLHIRNDAINAPFLLTARGIRARPLLAGMRLFSDTLGPKARITGLRVRAPKRIGLKTWGVRVGRRGLHVLVINKGSRTIRVQLRVRAVAGRATIRRLVGRALAADRGVVLQRPRVIGATNRGFLLTLRGPSAVVVRLTLAR